MAVFKLNEGKVIFDKDSPNRKVGRVKVVKEDDGTYTVYVNNEEHANSLTLSQLKTYLINKKDFGADKKLTKEVNDLIEDTIRKVNESIEEYRYDYDIGYCPELDITVLMQDTYSKETDNPISSELVSFLYGKHDLDEMYDDFMNYHHGSAKDALIAKF